MNVENFYRCGNCKHFEKCRINQKAQFNDKICDDFEGINAAMFNLFVRAEDNEPFHLYIVPDGNGYLWFMDLVKGKLEFPPTKEGNRFWRHEKKRREIANKIVTHCGVKGADESFVLAQITEISNKIEENAVLQGNKEQRKQEQQGKQNNVIKGHGGVFGDLVIEPLGGYRYLYNYDGKRGISTASYDKEIHINYIEIDGDRFVFDSSTPPIKTALFKVPSEQSIQKYINGTLEIKKPEEIFDDIVNYLKVLYDVEDESYYSIVAIGMLQSWLLPALDAVFYLYFTAKYGGGKTAFLEGLSIISRHGLMAGNISPSAIARMTHKYGLTLFADEFDVKTQSRDNELYLVFRQGYRRGSPYIRSGDSRNGFKEQIFDVFGWKACSIHGTIESALKTRGLPIPLRASRDYTLPILNLYKEKLGFPIFEELFFWYMENTKNLVADVAVVSLLSAVFADKSKKNGTNIGDAVLQRNKEQEQQGKQKQQNIIEVRRRLFKEITKDFDEEEVETLSKFFGRNEELLFIALKVCKAFGIHQLPALQSAFTRKAEGDQLYSDNFLIELLKETLIDAYKENRGNEAYILRKGEFAGCFYFPKMELYQRYREKLKENDIRGISSDRFTNYLQELDFTGGINIRKERFNGKVTKALIFDNTAKRALDIEDAAVRDVISPEIREKTPDNTKIASDNNVRGKDAVGETSNYLLDFIPYEPRYTSIREIMGKFGYEGNEFDYEQRKDYIIEELKNLAEDGRVKIIDKELTKFCLFKSEIEEVNNDRI